MPIENPTNNPNSYRLERFKVDGVQIRTPFTYKPVFATTSTEDSDRTQDLKMHNTVMGTVYGYDMTWERLRWDEISVIISSMINKNSFIFHHPSPLVPWQWIDSAFYVADFNMDAQDLSEGVGVWTNLSINVRSINPVNVDGGEC